MNEDGSLLVQIKRLLTTKRFGSHKKLRRLRLKVIRLFSLIVGHFADGVKVLLKDQHMISNLVLLMNTELECLQEEFKIETLEK